MSRFWFTLLAVTAVVSVVADFFGPSYEPHGFWDTKTFFAFYGFVGCVVIIFASKWIGKFWLLRKEAYYEPHRAPQPGEPEFELQPQRERKDG